MAVKSGNPATSIQVCWLSCRPITSTALPLGSVSNSRFSRVAPSFFKPSALSDFSNSANAPGGRAPSNSATFRSRSSKPGKLALACSCGGGTKPTREPGG